MALSGLNAVGGFELPFKNGAVSMPKGNWEKKSGGPAFGGINPQTKATPQYQQSIGEKPFDWHSLAKFDQKSPVLNGVGSDLGNKFDYMA